MGIRNQLLLCQAWPWPSAEVICPCYTCLEPDTQQATAGSRLKLDYFYITVKKLRVNDKSTQEKQVFMCTSAEKKFHCHHQSAFREEKKQTIDQWEKLPQLGTQFVEHRQK